MTGESDDQAAESDDQTSAGSHVFGLFSLIVCLLLLRICFHNAGEVEKAISFHVMSKQIKLKSKC